MTYSVARNKATQKYKAKNYKRIPLEVSIDKYDEIKRVSKEHNESVNGYIKKAIDMRIKGGN